MIIHGLSECYYYSGGSLKPLAGGVSLSLNPKISVAFDNRVRGEGKNVKYIMEGYDGSIELAAIPFDFLRDILGYTIDEDGTITENYVSSGGAREFRLLYQTRGARYILYSCTSAVPEFKTQTDGKGITVQTISIPIYARRDTSKRIRAFNANEDSTAYKTYFGHLEG